MRTFYRVSSLLLILLSSFLLMDDKIDKGIYAAISAIYFLLLSKEEEN